jgi:hypothetical protein
MIKKILLGFTILLFLFSCSKEKEKKQKVKVIEKQEKVVGNKELEDFKKYKYFDFDRVTENKYNVLKTGDFRAYGELTLFYSYNKSKRLELLPYSIIMVEKHKKYKYCTDVFKNILELSTDIDIADYYNGKDESFVNYLKNLKKLSEEQRNYALSYLKLGVKNKDYGSIKYLEIIYKNGLGVPKDLQLADNLKKAKTDFEKKNFTWINKKK